MSLTIHQQMRLTILNDKAVKEETIKDEKKGRFIDACLDEAVDCGLNIDEFIDALLDTVSLARQEMNSTIEREYF